MRPPALTAEAELAQRPHGTRVRYVAGRCRCEPCRAANREYARLRGKLQRDGDWNGVVPARRARKHLIALSKAGVGRNTVADITGVPRSVIAALVSGKRTQLRARNERKILAVTAEASANDAKLVRALETVTRIEALLAEGFTRTFIARRLGSKAKTPTLQIAKRGRVTAKTEARVKRLYHELTS